MKWLISILSFFFLVSCAINQEYKSKPNIVIVLADDLGWKDVG